MPVRVGAGWGRRQGDRRGKTEAGGSEERLRSGAEGGRAGNRRQRQTLDHHGNQDGEMGNRDPGGRERKRREQSSTKGESATESADEKWPRAGGRERCAPARRPRRE